VTALVWGSFAFLLVATAGSAAFAGVRALRAWRELRAAHRIVGGGLIEVTRRLSAAEARIARAGEGTASVEREVEHLQESLRIASLLLGAAQDAHAGLRWRSLLEQ
jgi:hypothetical protein